MTGPSPYDPCFDIASLTVSHGRSAYQRWHRRHRMNHGSDTTLRLKPIRYSLLFLIPGPMPSTDSERVPLLSFNPCDLWKIDISMHRQRPTQQPGASGIQNLKLALESDQFLQQCSTAYILRGAPSADKLSPQLRSKISVHIRSTALHEQRSLMSALAWRPAHKGCIHMPCLDR